MGHLEAVAGGAGAVSVVVASLPTGWIVSNAQVRRLNPHLITIIGDTLQAVIDIFPSHSGLFIGRLTSLGATGTIAHSAFATSSLFLCSSFLERQEATLNHSLYRTEAVRGTRVSNSAMFESKLPM